MDMIEEIPHIGCWKVNLFQNVLKNFILQSKDSLFRFK